jgi:hypothetical protein
MFTDACFSDDRRYRYWLIRIWDQSLPVMANIGVNPSIANETDNDPTIRKDIGFAQCMGFGGLLKMNLAAYCSTDPRACRKAYAPIGFFNAAYLMRGYAEKFKATKVVAAWGKNGRYFPIQEADVIKEFRPQLYCFGRNGDGTPRHTLMLPYTTKLVRY